MKTKAIYALSADPIHFGHLDIIRRASRDFDLTVLVADNPSKKYLFTLPKRVSMVLHALHCADLQSAVRQVVGLTDPSKLTADYAFENNISVIIRGVRNFSDYDMEAMIRDVNVSQQSGIETYLLKCDQSLGHISSGAVKELFNHAGFIHQYVPLCVKRELEQSSGLYIIGVTGNIASGKNWVCEQLMQADMNITHLDVDKLAHFLLFQSTVPAHGELRRKIRETFPLFGSMERGIFTAPLSQTERANLGSIVFADSGERAKLNAIMGQPIMTALRRTLYGRKGIVLLNSALLAEFYLSHICNNLVVLVTTDDETRKERLKGRGLSDEQIEHRLASQFTDERKRYHLEQSIHKDRFGTIIPVDNSSNVTIDITRLLDDIKTVLHVK
jgi:pantetheine-phosphate adenylyltransferase